MEKNSKKLSYESDGEMGSQKKIKSQKDQKSNEKDMFFNTTQNSE